MKYLFLLLGIVLCGCASDRANYSCSFTDRISAPGVPEGVLPTMRASFIVPSTSAGQASLLMRTLDPYATDVRCEQWDF